MSPAPAERPGTVGGEGGPDEPPPVLRAWGSLYALVITGLVLEILVCAWLSRLPEG